MDGNGGGLIAAPSDAGSAEWGCKNTLIPGADGIAIGTGYQNTINIVSACNTPGIAADICLKPNYRRVTVIGICPL